jgi:hypothetical protein
MTVAPTGYLKSHPAKKQEAQLKKLSKSASIFIVFFNFQKGNILKTKIAKHIKKLYLNMTISSLDFLS